MSIQKTKIAEKFCGTIHGVTKMLLLPNEKAYRVCADCGKLFSAPLLLQSNKQNISKAAKRAADNLLNLQVL